VRDARGQARRQRVSPRRVVAITDLGFVEWSVFPVHELVIMPRALPRPGVDPLQLGKQRSNRRSRRVVERPVNNAGGHAASKPAQVPSRDRTPLELRPGFGQLGHDGDPHRDVERGMMLGTSERRVMLTSDGVRSERAARRPARGPGTSAEGSQTRLKSVPSPNESACPRHSNWRGTSKDTSGGRRQ
jgi:hypothetical protein